MLHLVGSLHYNRERFTNMERFGIARALLRCAWSLSYGTITDFVNVCQPAPGQNGFTINELVAFYQCNHNHYFLEQVCDQIKFEMEETARGVLPSLNILQNPHLAENMLYQTVLIYKGAGHCFSNQQRSRIFTMFSDFITIGALSASTIHPDGRHMVFHVIDALHRSVSRYDQKNDKSEYAHILEFCCKVIAENEVIFTIQDTSAVLRALHHYSSSTIGVLRTLEKIGDHMKLRLGEPEAYATDFIRNMKLYATKYLNDQGLLDAFYNLVVKDLGRRCKPQCNHNGHNKKFCHALTLLDMSDVMEILSMINYNFQDEPKFFNFLVTISNRMMDGWDRFQRSGYNNKDVKVAMILTSFQTFGFYPSSFLKSPTVENFVKYQINKDVFQNWFRIKHEDYKVWVVIYYNVV